MNETGYLILSIAIIVCLIIIFVVTYVLNHKTKAPECDFDDIDLEKCKGCYNFRCGINKVINRQDNEEDEN